MLVTAIVAGTIGLIGGLVWLINYLKDDSYHREGGVLWGSLFWIFGTIGTFAFLGSIHFSIGTSNLTGYIYSAETRLGYTTGHIRFSEQAGQDVQPSFCVKADSEPGRKITELAGSGKKVKVTIPPYFYFSNNLFACGTTEMTIEEVSHD